MSTSSSPIKNSNGQPQTASQATSELRDFGVITNVSGDDFVTSYLSNTAGEDNWSPEQQQLINEIQTGSFSGKEPLLYTHSAPLLRLFNVTSARIISSNGIPRKDDPALVFRTCHNRPISNPFSKYPLAPDIVVLWEKWEDLEQLIGKHGSKPIRRYIEVS
jgi:hypothetical protein